MFSFVDFSSYDGRESTSPVQNKNMVDNATQTQGYIIPNDPNTLGKFIICYLHII